MNELLQKHGCANVFTVPEGLKELMSDITREVLREQPEKIFDFIANYLSVLLITREHGVMAVKILDDLCDCRPSLVEHLVHLGVPHNQAQVTAQIINDEISGLEPIEGKEKVREYMIVKNILKKVTLDEEMTANVCQVIRNAYRDYWYRKKVLEESMKMNQNEPWELAAQHTLEIYKRTKPSFDELTRATIKIQAAYRGYHIRRNVIRNFKPKAKKSRPKLEIPGPPLDIAGSREIDLGNVIDIKTRDDDVVTLFNEETGANLGLQYDPMTAITHVEDKVADSYQPKSRVSIKTSETTEKKRQQFNFSVKSKTSSPETIMRTEIEPIFPPSDYEKNKKIGAITAPRLSKSLNSRRKSGDGSLPFISFSEVPPEVFILDDAEPLEEIEYPAEPDVEAPSPFADEEIPEDIPADDVYGEDTVPTASSANSTDVEDIVSDVGEEQR